MNHCYIFYWYVIKREGGNSRLTKILCTHFLDRFFTRILDNSHGRELFLLLVTNIIQCRFNPKSTHTKCVQPSIWLSALMPCRVGKRAKRKNKMKA